MLSFFFFVCLSVTVTARPRHSLTFTDSHKVPYVTIVKTHLPKIFKNKNMSIYTKVPGFHRQDPAVAMLGRFPIETHAKLMCDTLVGGSLLCGSEQFALDKFAKECKARNWPVVTDPADHSLHNFHIKYVMSLYEMADRYDRIMVNTTKGKFLTHVVINSVLPQTSFLPAGTDVEELSGKIVSRLRKTVKAVTAARDDGKTCLVSVMRTCPPEIMLPPMEQRYDIRTDLGAFALPEDERKHIRRVLRKTGFDVKNMCYMREIRSLLDALVNEKIADMRPMSETRVIGCIPAPLAEQLAVKPDARGIQLRGSSSSTDPRLMELAQIPVLSDPALSREKPTQFPGHSVPPEHAARQRSHVHEATVRAPERVHRGSVGKVDGLGGDLSRDKAVKYHCKDCRKFFKSLTTHTKKQQLNVRNLSKFYKTAANGKQKRQWGTCTFEK